LPQHNLAEIARPLLAHEKPCSRRRVRGIWQVNRAPPPSRVHPAPFWCPAVHRRAVGAHNPSYRQCAPPHRCSRSVSRIRDAPGGRRQRNRYMIDVPPIEIGAMGPAVALRRRPIFATWRVGEGRLLAAGLKSLTSVSESKTGEPPIDAHLAETGTFIPWVAPYLTMQPVAVTIG